MVHRMTRGWMKRNARNDFIRSHIDHVGERSLDDGCDAVGLNLEAGLMPLGQVRRVGEVGIFLL
jgi:hypothetical protein